MSSRTACSGCTDVAALETLHLGSFMACLRLMNKHALHQIKLNMNELLELTAVVRIVRCAELEGDVQRLFHPEN
jgi:hypothetical protein